MFRSPLLGKLFVFVRTATQSQYCTRDALHEAAELTTYLLYHHQDQYCTVGACALGLRFT